MRTPDLFVRLLLLLLAVSHVTAQPLSNVCLRDILPRLAAGCEAQHAGASPSSNLTAATLLQWIGACVDLTDQTLNVLAPQLSVISVVGSIIARAPPQVLGAANVRLNALPNINLSAVPISVWGRTLSQVGGVDPVKLGIEPGTPAPPDYDAWLVDPVALADMVTSGRTLDLSAVVLDSQFKEAIEWVGIHQLFRGSVVVDAGTVSSLPFGGLIYQMYYRRDVLAAHNLTVPRTWDDFLAVAAKTNGTDMNGDGRPDYGVCLQRPRYCFNGFNLAAIWSSFVQSQGTKQGGFFDTSPGDGTGPLLTPLVNNSAMAAAMQLYAALRAYGPPDELTAPCLPYNQHFVMGNCALTLSWGFQMKANTFLNNSVVRDTASVALLPGSTRVLNRTTGQLVPCTSREVCPYSDDEPVMPAPGHGPGPQPEPLLVNRAPYLALATVSAAINNHASVGAQSRLLSLIAYLTSRNVSWELVTNPMAELGPYRYEHFDPANINKWVAKGYPRSVISEFLEVMKAQVDSNNVMLEVRTVEAYTYRRALDIYATLISDGTMDVPSAMGNLTKDLMAAYGPRNPRLNTIRRLYLYSIGNLDHLDAPGTPPAPGPSPGPSPGSSQRYITAAVVAPIACSLAALVVLLGVYAAVQHRRRAAVRRGRKGHPGLGEDTTLVVTDVEASTVLWEAIDASVMDVVFNLHHDCMRRTAVRFGGYESQTEGDSFIIAFHTADDAVHFALEVQAALLHEPWPPELLAHDKCRPVWLTRTCAHVPLELPYETAAAAPAHAPPPARAAAVAQPGAVAVAPVGSQTASAYGYDGLPSGGHSHHPALTECGSGRVSAAQVQQQVHSASAAGTHTHTSGVMNSMYSGVGGGGAGGGGGGGGVLSLGMLRQPSHLLRHALVWKWGSKRRVHSLNGAENTNLDAHPAKLAAAHSMSAVNGLHTPHVQSTSGVLLGPGTNPGAAGYGTSYAPTLPPVQPTPTPERICCVADALQAMWREVSVPAGVDPSHTAPAHGTFRRHATKGASKHFAFSRPASPRCGPSTTAHSSALASALAGGTAFHASAVAEAASSGEGALDDPARLQVHLVHGGSTVEPGSPRCAEVLGQGAEGQASPAMGAVAAPASGPVDSGDPEALLRGEGSGEQRPVLTSGRSFGQHFSKVLSRLGSGNSAIRRQQQQQKQQPHRLSSPGTFGIIQERGLPHAPPPIRTHRSSRRGLFGGGSPTLREQQQQRHHSFANHRAGSHHSPLRNQLHGLSNGVDGRAELESMYSGSGPLGIGTAATSPGAHHAAAGGAAAPLPPLEQCTLVYRGLKVRFGMHTGIRHSTDLVYSEVAARWKYSGEVLAAAKTISDAANGGEVLIGSATLERLSHDVLTKRCCMLYLGRHVLRGGGAAAATAGGASGASTLAPPVPGGLADLYSLYSVRLLPRMGLYRPPRTAQALGLSVMDAPIGKLSYGLLVCHGLAEMALHHDSSVVSEARQALVSITNDQLMACHGAPAMQQLPAGAGSVAGAFQNPFHAILWALQAQEDLLHHPWSQELLAHEQFEEIAMPNVVADALIQQHGQQAGSVARAQMQQLGLPRATSSAPTVRGQRGRAHSHGHEQHPLGDYARPPPRASASVTDFCILPLQRGPEKSAASASAHASASGLAAAFDVAKPARAYSRSIDGSGTLPTPASAGGGAHSGRGSGGSRTSPGELPRAAAGGGEVPADGSRPAARTSPVGAAAPSAALSALHNQNALAGSNPESVPPQPAPADPSSLLSGTTAYTTRTTPVGHTAFTTSAERSFTDVDRDSFLVDGGFLTGGWGGAHLLTSVLVNTNTNLVNTHTHTTTNTTTGTDADSLAGLAHGTPHEADANMQSQSWRKARASGSSAGQHQLQHQQLPLHVRRVGVAAAAAGASLVAEDEGPFFDCASPLPSITASGMGAGAGGAAVGGSAGAGQEAAPGAAGGADLAATLAAGDDMVLFKGPRIKGAITYGTLKAALDPLTGRLRYEGKAVAQASKLVSYAAIGMVVASVEAVEHGHAEEAEGAARPDAGGASRSPLHPNTNGRSAPTRQPSALPIDRRMSSLASALPSPLLRQESFIDPEGPSAAMAAAAAAAADALLSLAPGGGGSSGGGRARLGRARSYSLEQGIAVLQSRGSIDNKQTPMPSGSYSYSLRLPAGLGAAAVPGLDRHAGEVPSGHRNAGSDSGADAVTAETASEPLPRAPLRGRNCPAAAGADGRQATGSDREQGQVLSNWAGAGQSCSQASSGYSTPVSCSSYTYGSMVVPSGPPASALQPGPSGSGGSGSASTTAAAAAAGGWSMFPLKVDGRAPSRTAAGAASRTMSNLNPDSRQGSRTHMQRQSGLSNTPTATGFSDVTVGLPHRSDASAAPATAGGAAGGAGGAAAGAPALPPALQHGRSWHVAAHGAADSALLQSWGSFDFSPATGGPAEAAHGVSSTSTDVHTWQPMPVLPGRNGPAPGKPPLAATNPPRAHVPSTSSVFRPRGASLPHNLAQRVPSTSATTSSGGTGLGQDATGPAGAYGSDDEDADGGFALATIDLPLPPSREHPQADAGAAADGAGAGADPAGEVSASIAPRPQPPGDGEGHSNQPGEAIGASGPEGGSGGQAAWTGARSRSHHAPPPSQPRVTPSHPPVARGNSDRGMGVASRGRTSGPPPPSLLGTGSYAASLAGSTGGAAAGAGTEEATALANRPLSASLGRDRLQKLLLMQQAGAGVAFLGGAHGHGQGQGHAGTALPSVQVLSASSTSVTGGQLQQQQQQQQSQVQANPTWSARRWLAPPPLALTATGSLLRTHDSLASAAGDAGSPGGRHPLRSYTQNPDGRFPGNGPSAGAATQFWVPPSAPVSAAPSRKVGSEWLTGGGGLAAGSGRSVRGRVGRDPSMLALLSRLGSGTGGAAMQQHSQGQEQQGHPQLQQQHSQGQGHGHGQAVPTANPLEAVGLDEVTMTPVALKKRTNSHPVVVYLCRFTSGERAATIQRQLVTMGYGGRGANVEAVAAAAAAAVQVAMAAVSGASSANGAAPVGQAAPSGQLTAEHTGTGIAASAGAGAGAGAAVSAAGAADRLDGTAPTPVKGSLLERFDRRLHEVLRNAAGGGSSSAGGAAAPATLSASTAGGSSSTGARRARGDKAGDRWHTASGMSTAVAAGLVVRRSSVTGGTSGLPAKPTGADLQRGSTSHAAQQPHPHSAHLPSPLPQLVPPLTTGGSSRAGAGFIRRFVRGHADGPGQRRRGGSSARGGAVGGLTVTALDPSAAEVRTLSVKRVQRNTSIGASAATLLQPQLPTYAASTLAPGGGGAPGLPPAPVTAPVPMHAAGSADGGAVSPTAVSVAPTSAPLAVAPGQCQQALMQGMFSNGPPSASLSTGMLTSTCLASEPLFALLGQQPQQPRQGPAPAVGLLQQQQQQQAAGFSRPEHPPSASHSQQALFMALAQGQAQGQGAQFTGLLDGSTGNLVSAGNRSSGTAGQWMIQGFSTAGLGGLVRTTPVSGSIGHAVLPFGALNEEAAGEVEEKGLEGGGVHESASVGARAGGVQGHRGMTASPSGRHPSSRATPTSPPNLGRMVEDEGEVEEAN